jgi:hypothetical protein
MPNIWTAALAESYEVLFAVFEETLRACPDDLWEASMWDVAKDHGWARPKPPVLPDGRPDPRGIQVHSAFWHVAYHMLFFLDANFSQREPSWAPPAPFGKHDLGSGVLPPRTYTRDELIGYLAFDREKARRTLAVVTDQDAAAPAPQGAPRTIATWLVDNLRHAVWHQGNLEVFVWQHRE